jgi:hypothetical protein
MTKARTLADNFAADINQVSAGVGITGGGTSGTVTITNDMATTIAAKGDLVVGTGNDTYNRLAVASTAGYLLTVDSAESTGLKWAAPAGGGKVLQVVSATYSTGTTITTSTYTDTGLTASITPTLASSKILVMIMHNISVYRTSNPATAQLQIVRGSTSIWDGAGSGGAMFRIFATPTGGELEMTANQTFIYVDSPSSTSSLTYKTQGKLQYTGDSGQVAFQPSGRPSQIILMEIGA